jgi:2-polyprenyl-3-methyl-5-hydroxy-6-metoxy-1,4-benzoquinol methylase
MYKDKRALIARYVRKGTKVLDVGFAGQAVTADDPVWPHALLKQAGAEVWGLDLELADEYAQDPHYVAADAEAFSLPERFEVIFAGDVIEHLSNPGAFLTRCRAHLAPGGVFLITTPNAFNLFTMSDMLTHREPQVHPEHTMYFTGTTLTRLLTNNGLAVQEIGTLFTQPFRAKPGTRRESMKKRLLNALYRLLSKKTDKFVETLVVVAKSDESRRPA